MQGWHVIIPGLCGPFPKHSVLSEQAASPLLGLLAGGRTQSAAIGYHAQLASLFELPQALPVAALTRLADGACSPGDNCMLLAPVHLQADMDHAILYDEFALALSAQEKQQLQDELNAHFAEDDICIISDAAGRWFVQSARPIAIETTALHEVIGRNVNFYMPTGPQAVSWKRFLNEAQMLMHQSAVNQTREQHGQLTANSLWLWGQGSLPEHAAALDTVIYTNDDLMRGIARHRQCACHDLPQEDAVLPQHAVFCDTRLLSAVSYGDTERWQQDLHNMMAQWLQHLPQWAQRQRARVTLYPCSGTAYRLPETGWGRRLCRVFGRRLTARELIQYDD